MSFQIPDVDTEFDTDAGYQPMPKNDICYFDYLGLFRFYNDGSVTPLDKDTHFEWDTTSSYPRFYSGMSCYTVHRIIGKILWPLKTRPPELKYIDHIDGCTSNNAWKNLRPVTPSMNAINRRSKKRPIKGWEHETEAWLTKINACMAKKGKPVWRKAKDARNKYIAKFTSQGKRIEIGAFDTPAEAHEAYLNGREQHIKDELRSIWMKHMNTE